MYWAWICILSRFLCTSVSQRWCGGHLLGNFSPSVHYPNRRGSLTATTKDSGSLSSEQLARCFQDMSSKRPKWDIICLRKFGYEESGGEMPGVHSSDSLCLAPCLGLIIYHLCPSTSSSVKWGYGCLHNGIAVSECVRQMAGCGHIFSAQVLLVPFHPVLLRRDPATARDACLSWAPSVSGELHHVNMEH